MKWGSLRFGDLYSEKTRNGVYKSAEYHGHGIKIVNMGELFANGFIGPQSMERVELSEKEMQTSLLLENDLLFARRSLVESGAGKASIVRGLCEMTTFESSVIRVRLNTDICVPMFYYYWFKSHRGREAIQPLVTGVNVKGIRGSELLDMKVDYPPLQTQNRIASFLYAYDSLIEKNLLQIKLLEEAAQRLYKEWFIDLRFPGRETTPIHDGIPEGWRMISMDNIADYLNGYAFKPSDWGTTGMPIIKIKELNDGVTKDTPRNNGESIPKKYIVHPGEILFSWSATLTAKIWDSESGLLNQHLFKVTPAKGISREFVLQSILKTLDEFRNLTTGSTMKHIQRGKLKNVFVLVPTVQIMNLYARKSETIRESILTINRQNTLLAEARDRLLPKLMSGEIEV